MAGSVAAATIASFTSEKFRVNSVYSFDFWMEPKMADHQHDHLTRLRLCLCMLAWTSNLLYDFWNQVYVSFQRGSLEGVCSSALGIPDSL